MRTKTPAECAHHMQRCYLNHDDSPFPIQPSSEPDLPPPLRLQGGPDDPPFTPHAAEYFEDLEADGDAEFEDKLGILKNYAEADIARRGPEEKPFHRSEEAMAGELESSAAGEREVELGRRFEAEVGGGDCHDA
jgi:hypothetical protein